MDRYPAEMTDDNTIVTDVEIMTTRVMRWFGFNHASDYILRPYAATVAVELYRSGIRAANLTREAIEEADERTGNNMGLFFDATNARPGSTSGPVLDVCLLKHDTPSAEVHKNHLERGCTCECHKKATVQA